MSESQSRIQNSEMPTGAMERLHGRVDKALANNFGGPGSISSTRCRRVNQTEKYWPHMSDAAV